MDGSVYGDRCSPIFDTTVLSSVWTGCDLMGPRKDADTPGNRRCQPRGYLLDGRRLLHRLMLA